MPLIMNAEVDKLNGLAPRECELCRRRDGTLRRCSACLAVYYCGRDCQVDDRDEHKVPCKLIKKARAAYESEEKQLRESPGTFFSPGNVFQDHVGHFWGIIETRDYMRARYHLVDTLLMSYGTAGGPVDLVQTCLDHLLDMLRLCRSDNMGVRDLVPDLYIRLGRDQDAYDFIKWYATTGRDDHYNWGDMDEPFLDVKDADVLEAPAKSLTNPDFLELSHAVALMLIKVRILLDLQAIQNATIALHGVIPQEIIELIRDQLVSCLIRSRKEILLAGPDKTAQLVQTIKRQITELYRTVEKYNTHFWDLLINDPDAGVLRRPTGPYASRTRNEALLTLGHCYSSWYETPGAVDMLRSLGKPS
ncbi:hypothetical protein E4U41_002195 [Claviceps citrina]|nr:hypothetical protein E4U41_002195 [Claviceps citrina]